MLLGEEGCEVVCRRRCRQPFFVATSARDTLKGDRRLKANRTFECVENDGQSV